MQVQYNKKFNELFLSVQDFRIVETRHWLVLCPSLSTNVGIFYHNCTDKAVPCLYILCVVSVICTDVVVQRLPLHQTTNKNVRTGFLLQKSSKSWNLVIQFRQYTQHFPEHKLCAPPCVSKKSFLGRLKITCVFVVFLLNFGVENML